MMYCAAEPTSLAPFAKACCSCEVWSTAASMPVLSNSTTIETNEANTKIMLTAKPKPAKHKISIKAPCSHKSWRKPGSAQAKRTPWQE